MQALYRDWVFELLTCPPACNINFPVPLQVVAAESNRRPNRPGDRLGDRQVGLLLTYQRWAWFLTQCLLAQSITTPRQRSPLLRPVLRLVLRLLLRVLPRLRW